MLDIEQLLAIEAIRLLKARYFRLLDAKEFEAFGALFIDDARIDVRGAVDATESNAGEFVVGFNDAAIIIGGKAMAEFVRGVISNFDSVHQGFMPQIEVLSPTSASGVWAMQDRLWPLNPDTHQGFVGYGHYHETYAKIGGDWKIASMSLARQRVAPW